MIPTTRDFSVKFGRTPEMGMEAQKAFPFIYTLVNYNDDTWEPGTPGAQPSMAHIGPAVGPGATVNHNILLDPDYNFKLLAIKFTVYYWDSRDGAFWWTGDHFGNEMTDPDVLKNDTPLTRYLRVTLAFQGSGSALLYGGPHNSPFVPTFDVNGRFPMPIELSQGYESGHYTVRSPYLLPREAILSFTFTNDHTIKTLYVGAAIFGMKIRI
jgi:hypothetical protein